MYLEKIILSNIPKYVLAQNYIFREGPNFSYMTEYSIAILKGYYDAILHTKIGMVDKVLCCLANVELLP